VRTIIVGLVYLATFTFSANAVGLTGAACTRVAAAAAGMHTHARMHARTHARMHACMHACMTRHVLRAMARATRAPAPLVLLPLWAHAGLAVQLLLFPDSLSDEPAAPRAPQEPQLPKVTVTSSPDDIRKAFQAVAQVKSTPGSGTSTAGSSSRAPAGQRSSSSSSASGSPTATAAAAGAASSSSSISSSEEQ
jgi:hypothetical protein